MPAGAPVSLVLTTTQNPTEYVGVVQIRRKENTEAVIETIGPVKGPAASDAMFTLTLHRELLFSQDSPILDVVFAGDGQLVFALGAEWISSYQWRDERWVRSGIEPLPRRRVPARGEHGFLSLGIDSEEAVFPRETCSISAYGGKGWICENSSSEQIPVRTVSNAAILGKKTGLWLSAAQLETEGKAELVVTGQDGLARLYEDAADPFAVFQGWGSEIASVHSGCGSGWQLLVTGPGDWTRADAIEAMEIKDRRAAPISAAMEFSGPIVTMHAPGMRTLDAAAADGKALVVDRNLQTGRYEAYLLSITCAN